MLIDAEFTTHDRADADDLIRRVYPGSGFRECASPFTFKQRVVGDATVTIAQFAVNSQSEVLVDLEGIVGIGTATGGNYRLINNDQAVDASKPFVLSPGKARSRSSHHRLTMTNLQHEALRVRAGADSRRDRLHVNSKGPLTDAAAGYWFHVARHAAMVFSAPSLGQYELIHQATVDLVLASAIDVFGMTLERSTPHSETALPRAVRRGITFMEENAAAPIGVLEVAEASRVSIRGLQAAFRKALDMTPMEYLRQVRLSEARRELIASGPEDTSVTHVSRQWGFSNLSRFTASYLEEFEETPRQTLER